MHEPIKQRILCCVFVYNKQFHECVFFCMHACMCECVCLRAYIFTCACQWPMAMHLKHIYLQAELSCWALITICLPKAYEVRHNSEKTICQLTFPTTLLSISIIFPTTSKKTSSKILSYNFGVNTYGQGESWISIQFLHSRWFKHKLCTLIKSGWNLEIY